MTRRKIETTDYIAVWNNDNLVCFVKGDLRSDRYVDAEHARHYHRNGGDPRLHRHGLIWSLFVPEGDKFDPNHGAEIYRVQLNDCAYIDIYAMSDGSTARVSCHINGVPVLAQDYVSMAHAFECAVDVARAAIQRVSDTFEAAIRTENFDTTLQ